MMTGEQLWNTFIAAKISDHDLRALGYELYFARAEPKSKEAIRAVVMFGNTLRMIPRLAYNAMNSDPGRTTLEELGLDYERHLPWGKLHPRVTSYVERTAHRINIINGAAGAQAASAHPATASPTPKKTPSAARFAPFIIGASLVAGIALFGKKLFRHRSAMAF